MKLLLPGMPVPASSVDVSSSRCSGPVTVEQPGLVRTRAFAAVPSVRVRGGEVRPGTGVLGGTRPAGSPWYSPIHVDLDPFRPRPSGGPSQD